MCWITLAVLCFITTQIQSQTFRAAVVEFPFLAISGANPRQILLHNAKRYEEYVIKAAHQKTEIIIFPEYGLTTWAALNQTRNTIQPYVQHIPEIKQWNPCTDAETPAENIQILVLLSCMARNYSMVLVANLLTEEKCEMKDERKCLYFNSNVIFGQNGSLVGKYHKSHLFNEEMYLDSPLKPQYPIFDVGFAKIATFICFDIDFYEPAVGVVLDEGVQHVVFTSSWNSELPFSLAPQVFASWARGLGINFLAANYHYPKKAGLGSGIYSSQLGALNEYNDLSSTQHLIIADIPLNPQPVPNTNFNQVASCSSSPPETISNYSTKPFTISDKPSSKSSPNIHKIYYQNLNNFSITHLHELQTQTSINSTDVCCHVTYKLRKTNISEGYYSLLAYDGFRQYANYKWPIQVCSVLWCSTSGGVETCGRAEQMEINTSFERLSLVGIFTTEAVFPSVINSDLQNTNGKLWKYSKHVDKSLKITHAVIELQLSDSILGINMMAIKKNRKI